MTTSIKSSFLSVDHYGLVVATSRTLGLAEFIDSKIPKLSNNKKISYGQLFECMLINFLAYTSEPLYLTPKSFESFSFGFGVQKKDSSSALNINIDGSYDYDTWNTPTYHERLKPGYYTLQKYLEKYKEMNDK